MSPTITIDDILQHLLMEEAQVCLPGIGTLRRTPRSATLSALDSKAMPPSELVGFNANLVLDDGRLLQALQEHLPDEPAEAQRMLDEFLRNMRENLDAGRSFTIDGVGRFYKPYDGQVQFTQSGDNFSKPNFGLPPVDLVPIKRTEKQKRAAADPMLAGSSTTAPASAPEKGIRKKREWFRRPAADPTKAAEAEGLLYNDQLKSILWYVAAAVGIIVALMLVFQLFRFFADDQVVADNGNLPRLERPRKTVPADRINVSPDPVDAREVAPTPPPRLNQPKPTTPPVTNTAPTTDQTPPTTAPATTTTDNVALIATGMFGSQRNVEKNLNRIESAGFRTFARPEGRLTRIGARFEYETEEELFTALERIRRLYSDAFVMEVNGEKRNIE